MKIMSCGLNSFSVPMCKIDIIRLSNCQGVTITKKRLLNTPKIKVITKKMVKGDMRKRVKTAASEIYIISLTGMPYSEY